MNVEKKFSHFKKSINKSRFGNIILQHGKGIQDYTWYLIINGLSKLSTVIMVSHHIIISSVIRGFFVFMWVSFIVQPTSDDLSIENRLDNHIKYGKLVKLYCTNQSVSISQRYPSNYPHIPLFVPITSIYLENDIRISAIIDSNTLNILHEDIILHLCCLWWLHSRSRDLLHWSLKNLKCKKSPLRALKISLPLSAVLRNEIIVDSNHF